MKLILCGYNYIIQNLEIMIFEICVNPPPRGVFLSGSQIAFT
jgi:hypothetical protein